MRDQVRENTAPAPKEAVEQPILWKLVIMRSRGGMGKYRNFRAVQWLKLHTPNAGALGSVPCQGTKILCAVRHNEEK